MVAFASASSSMRSWTYGASAACRDITGASDQCVSSCQTALPRTPGRALSLPCAYLRSFILKNVDLLSGDPREVMKIEARRDGLAEQAVISRVAAATCGAHRSVAAQQPAALPRASFHAHLQPVTGKHIGAEDLDVHLASRGVVQGVLKRRAAVIVVDVVAEVDTERQPGRRSRGHPVD